MGLIQNIQKRDNIAIMFLFLPNILRWMPFRTFPLTIKLGVFPFFWPAIFYILYLLYTKKKAPTANESKIRGVIWTCFFLCPLVLLMNEGGSYASALWIQDMILYLVLFSFFFHTPSNSQLAFVKWLVIALYVYILLQMIVSSLGIYQFDENDVVQDGMRFIRSGTKAGDSNQTSVVLFLFMALITGFYSQKTKINLIIIAITIVAIAMGATRGPLIASTTYFVVFLFAQMKGSSLTQKIGSFLIAVTIVGAVVEYNVFADVLFRQQELAQTGNLTSNRTDFMKEAIDKSMADSPIVGVGQGRVYPPTDEISRIKENHNLNYSKYAGAPHNVWVLMLCEYGYLGFILLFYACIKLIKQMSFKEPITWSVILVFLVLFNTEAIIIHDQSLLLICFLIIAAIKKSKDCVTINT